MAQDNHDDSDYLPEWVEVLDRAPMAVDDNTDVDKLAAEMAERLSALLKLHMLEPTAEGWRQLALELALKHEPLFQLETPADRTGRSGIGGRPVGWEGTILRWMVEGEMRKGKSQAEAARAIAKQSRGKISFKTANNSLSRNAPPPDDARRAPYKWKADNAINIAARKLSQE